MFSKIKEMAKTNFGLLFILAVIAIVASVAGWIGNVTGILDLISKGFEWGASSPAKALLVWLVVSLILIWGAGRTVYNADKKTRDVIGEVKDIVSENRHLISLYRQQANIIEHQRVWDRDIRSMKVSSGVDIPSQFPIDSFNSTRTTFGPNTVDMAPMDASIYATKTYEGMDKMDETLGLFYKQCIAETEAVNRVLHGRLGSIKQEINQLERGIVRDETTNLT